MASTAQSKQSQNASSIHLLITFKALDPYSSLSTRNLREEYRTISVNRKKKKHLTFLSNSVNYAMFFLCFCFVLIVVGGYVCWGTVCVHERRCPWRPEEGVQSPQSWISGSYKLPDLGAKNHA